MGLAKPISCEKNCGGLSILHFSNVLRATEHENYMEIYDPKTFIAAVTAPFEQRTIEFTD
jgi:hypothetical protein